MSPSRPVGRVGSQHPAIAFQPHPLAHHALYPLNFCARRGYFRRPRHFGHLSRRREAARRSMTSNAQISQSSSMSDLIISLQNYAATSPLFH